MIDCLRAAVRSSICYLRMAQCLLSRIDAVVGGSCVLAYFGGPCAHKDDAERALRAGCSRSRQSARAPRPRSGCRPAWALRPAISLSAALPDRTLPITTRSVVRHPIRRPVCRLAQPRKAVISQATQRLVGGLFELDDLGPQPLKGFAAPLAVWRITGARRSMSRLVRELRAPLECGVTSSFAPALCLLAARRNETGKREWSDACSPGKVRSPASGEGPAAAACGCLQRV